MWKVVLRVPAVVALKVESELPSPQLTLTAHGESAPGSAKEPSWKSWPVPSPADWLAGAVTSGATLLTVTTVV